MNIHREQNSFDLSSEGHLYSRGLSTQSLSLVHLKLRQIQVVAWQFEHEKNLAEIKIAELEKKIQEIQYTANVFSNQLEALHQSKSWKLTRPLRWLTLQKNLLIEQGLKNRILFLFNKIQRFFNQYLSTHRKTNTVVSYVFHFIKVLQLKFFQQQSIQAHQKPTTNEIPKLFISEEALSTRGIEILQQLQQKILSQKVGEN